MNSGSSSSGSRGSTNEQGYYHPNRSLSAGRLMAASQAGQGEAVDSDASMDMSDMAEGSSSAAMVPQASPARASSPSLEPATTTRIGDDSGSAAAATADRSVSISFNDASSSSESQRAQQPQRESASPDPENLRAQLGAYWDARHAETSNGHEAQQSDEGEAGEGDEEEGEEVVEFDSRMSHGESTASEHSETDDLDDMAFGDEMERRLGVRRQGTCGDAHWISVQKRKGRTGWMGEAEARSLRRGPISGVMDGTAVAVAEGKYSKSQRRSQNMDENLRAVVDHHLSSTNFLYTPTTGGFYSSTTARHASTAMPHLLPSLQREAQSSSFAIRVLPDSWTMDGSGKCHRRTPFDPEQNEELANDFAEGDADRSGDGHGQIEAGHHSWLAIDAATATGKGNVSTHQGQVHTMAAASSASTRPRGISGAALEGDFDRLAMDELRERERAGVRGASTSTSIRRQNERTTQGGSVPRQPQQQQLPPASSSRATMDRGARRRTQSFMEPEMR